MYVLMILLLGVTIIALLVHKRLLRRRIFK